MRGVVVGGSRYALTVVARLDRATRYSSGVREMPRSRSVLDAPVKPGHDTCTYSITAWSGPVACLRNVALVDPIISASGMVQRMKNITNW